jgi:predicted branched-subunit amino acid permease
MVGATAALTPRSALDQASGGMPSPRWAAFRDVVEMSAGVVPFGVALGITTATSGVSGTAAVFGGLVVYAGGAQLTTMSLLGMGAGLLPAVLSGAIVQSRALLYGAALAPHFRGQPLWFRLLAPHFIVDQTYLAAEARGSLPAPVFRRYWCWAGGILGAVWLVAIASGVLVGPLLPPLPHLLLVGTALFIALLVPRLTSALMVVAAGVAAGVALLVSQLSPQIGILAGTLAGMFAAVSLGRWRKP